LPALQDIIYGLMTIESVYFGNQLITPERPDVEFVDTIAPDMQTLASVANLLDQANAASLETKVQLVHPDWTPDMVKDEVEMILEETGLELAGHAKVALTGPMNETLNQEVTDLAAPTQPMPVAQQPDETPTQPSTGLDAE